jgi:predicted O-methyltransferase YrrM
VAEIEILTPEIDRYLLSLFRHKDEVLQDMEEYGYRERIPIIGPLLGSILMLMAKAIRATRVLEMGSGYGYSAFWFARGLSEGGVVIACDQSEENARKARSYFERASMPDRLDFRTADALEVIDQTPGELDIVFIDCNKAQYPEALRKALPKVKRRGLIIAHNVLWYGTVVKGEHGGVTRYIKEFNQMLYNTPGLVTSIVPLWDGLSISLKE